MTKFLVPRRFWRPNYICKTKTTKLLVKKVPNYRFLAIRVYHLLERRPNMKISYKNNNFKHRTMKFCIPKYFGPRNRMEMVSSQYSRYLLPNSAFLRFLCDFFAKSKFLYEKTLFFILIHLS